MQLCRTRSQVFDHKTCWNKWNSNQRCADWLQFQKFPKKEVLCDDPRTKIRLSWLQYPTHWNLEGCDKSRETSTTSRRDLTYRLCCRHSSVQTVHTREGTSLVKFSRMGRFQMRRTQRRKEKLSCSNSWTVLYDVQYTDNIFRSSKNSCVAPPVVGSNSSLESKPVPAKEMN